MGKLFTDEELAELRKFDEELDNAAFHLTPEDVSLSRRLDREARLDKLDNRGRKIAEYQAAYREANRDKIAEYQAAYREANREQYNAYMRAYRRARREKKKAASDGANIESGKRGMTLPQL